MRDQKNYSIPKKGWPIYFFLQPPELEYGENLLFAIPGQGIFTGSILAVHVQINGIPPLPRFQNID